MQFSEVVDRPASEIMTLDEPVYKTLVCFPAFFLFFLLSTRSFISLSCKPCTENTHSGET